MRIRIAVFLLGIRGGIVLIVMGVLLCGMWIRSLGSADVLALFVTGGRVQAVGSHRGQVGLLLSNVDFGSERAWTLDAGSSPASEFDDVHPARWAGGVSHSFHGFGAHWNTDEGDPNGDRSYLVLAVPHWTLAGLCVGAGLLLLIPALRRAHWIRHGRCGACGYDLRSSPDRCPECGRAVPASP